MKQQEQSQNRRLDWVLSFFAKHAIQGRELESAWNEIKNVHPTIHIDGNESYRHQIINKLILDKYLEQKGDSYWITFKGLEFFQKPPFLFKGKPYQYERFKKEIIVPVWNITKVLAAVANAVAIIWLTYSSLSIQKKFNDWQTGFQEKIRIADSIKAANDDISNKESIKVQNEQKDVMYESSRPNIKSEGMTLTYLSQENSALIESSYRNIGTRDARNVEVFATFNFTGNHITKKIAAKLELTNIDDGYVRYNYKFKSDVLNKQFTLTVKFVYIDGQKPSSKIYKYKGVLTNGNVEYTEVLDKQYPVVMP